MDTLCQYERWDLVFIIIDTNHSLEQKEFMDQVYRTSNFD